MFKNERNKRLFHIFSNIFIAFVWGWILYVQSQVKYPTSFESNFQKVYMFVLCLFIIATVIRIAYHFFKLRKYRTTKKMPKSS